MTQNKNTFPQKSKSKARGKIGQAKFRLCIEELNLNYRENPLEDDYGIDGYIDCVLPGGGVTGKFVAVQVKYGKTYFNSDDGHEFYFISDYPHLNYFHNYQVPVLIVVSSEDENHWYWGLFDINKTYRHGSGWKMVIDRSNMVNDRFKDRLFAISGLIEDGISRAASQWDEAEAIDKAQIIFVKAYKCHIENCDMISLNHYFSKVMSPRKTLMGKSNSLEIYADGYDQDERSLVEIREYRWWIKEMDKHINSWFYFLNLTEPSQFAQNVFVIMCDAKIYSGFIEERYIIDFEVEMVHKFYTKEIQRLKIFCDDNGFGIQFSQKIFEKIDIFIQGCIAKISTENGFEDPKTKAFILQEINKL